MKERDIKFGRLLAYAEHLSRNVFEENKPTVFLKYSTRFQRKPSTTFTKIHYDIMEYAHCFGKDELFLIDKIMFIMSDMKESEFTDDPLNDKYILVYHRQMNILNNLDKIIGVDEAAKILGIKPKTVKNWCAADRLPAKKVSNAWVMERAMIEEWKEKTDDVSDSF